MNTKSILLLIPCLTGTVLLYGTDLSTYEVLAFSFSLFTFLRVFLAFGHTIALRELMGFVASLQLLFASAVEFMVQPQRIYVTSDDYFSYALPAVVLYNIGLFIPVLKTENHVVLINNAKNYLIGKESVSTVLLLIGLVGSLIYKTLPLEIRAIVYLFAICLYASVMYGHYLSGKTKTITLSIAFGLLIYTTVREGAFGHLIFWTTLYLLVVMTGSAMGKNRIIKLVIITAGIAFVILIQSIKFDYRQHTWGDKITERRADPELMMNLIQKQLTEPDYILSKDHFLSVTERFNQGSLLAMTLYYVPRMEPYANGELLLHFVYPLVPRLFWDEKPITGGVANITRFTPLIHSGMSSSNISPFGEAYANFGHIGGLLFLFFFGLLFNYSFSILLKLAESTPSVILWLPCLFSGCLTVETDVLSMWGSFVSTAVFIVIFWGLLKRIGVTL